MKSKMDQKRKDLEVSNKQRIIDKESIKNGKVGPHWSSSLDRQLLNSILASRHKSSASIFYTLDMIAQADDLHQSYILHTYSAFDSNEDDQCGPTFPLCMLPFKISCFTSLSNVIFTFITFTFNEQLEK